MVTSIATPSFGSRRPQGSPLLEYVRENLPAFLRHREDVRKPVPAFVLRDLNRYLACGDINCGHATMFCPRCDFEHDFCFSCKRRGFCTYCLVRRMLDRGAFLLNRVIGRLPVRQWAQSLPPPLRHLAGYSHGLSSKILSAHIASVFKYYKRKAIKLLAANGIIGDVADPGSLTVIHRASANLMANLHFHSVVTDGVFIRHADGSVTFLEVPTPTSAEVQDVAWDTCKRVRRLLLRLGMWRDVPPRNGDPERMVSGVLTMKISKRSKSSKRRVRFFATAANDERDKPVRRRGACAFDLWASQHVRQGDRKKLLRILHYVLAPPFRDEHLTLERDGRITLTLKRSRRDGTRTRTFTPIEFLAALVNLTPRPNANLVRFHGAFASNAKFRDQVVPPIPEAPPPPPPDDDEAVTKDRLAWAELLNRAYELDVKRCPLCSGRLLLIALKSDRMTYRRIRDESRAPPPDPAPEDQRIAA